MKERILITIAFVGAVASVFIFLTKEKDIVTNAPPKSETIVAFGDSLVEGVGADRGGGFVPLLEEHIENEITNLGAAGDTTEDGLLRIDEVLEREPGVVLLLFGGNDALRKVPIKETRTNLEQMITTFHGEGMVVVLLGVRGGILGDPYEQMYEELHEEYQTAYVPNVLKGVLLRPDLTHDQLHPNDEGYAIVARRIAPVLQTVLEHEADV